MLFFGVLSLLVAAVSAQDCFNDMVGACGTKDSSLENCNAVYGEFTEAKTDLQTFANANVQESFYLLLISSYFGNYDVNREGFKKLYRQYSDKLWEDAIDVMKYIAKRDGRMNFEQPSGLELKGVAFEEIKSLALVLDRQKKLAKLAFDIHYQSAEKVHHDPAIAHYIEERFLEKHTERIRDLSGYISELRALSVKNQNTTFPLSVFLFDEYLKKSL